MPCGTIVQRPVCAPWIRATALNYAKFAESTDATSPRLLHKFPWRVVEEVLHLRTCPMFSNTCPCDSMQLSCRRDLDPTMFDILPMLGGTASRRLQTLPCLQAFWLILSTSSKCRPVAWTQL